MKKWHMVFTIQTTSRTMGYSDCTVTGEALTAELIDEAKRVTMTQPGVAAAILISAIELEG